jgi:parallel beta-helix repeat protein
MVRGVRLRKNRFTRAGASAAFAVGADRVSGLEIRGNTVTGGRLGIYLANTEKSSLVDNHVTVTETAYWLVNSLGGNRSARNGPPSARWNTTQASLKPTDRLER